MIDSRNKSIDGLRGLAVMEVVLLHSFIHFPFSKVTVEHWPHRLVSILFWSGYYGVVVFFVISGFLITTISLKRWGQLSNINYRDFYMMRIARILPCLLLIVTVLILLHLAGVEYFTIQTVSLMRALLAVFAFHVNWLEATMGYLPANWDVLWSLSIEEMFYLLFPVVCVVLKDKRLWTVVLLALIIMGPFSRINTHANELWRDHAYLSCFDGIAMGCLAAFISNSISLSKTNGLIMFSMLCIVPVIFFRKLVYQAGIATWGLNVSLLELGIGLWLIAMVHNHSSNSQRIGLRWLLSVIAFFGRYSYEIYLTHVFVILLMKKLFLAPSLILSTSIRGCK